MGRANGATVDLFLEQLESFELALQAEGFVSEAGFRGFDLSLQVLFGLGQRESLEELQRRELLLAVPARAGQQCASRRRSEPRDA